MSSTWKMLIIQNVISLQETSSWEEGGDCFQVGVETIFV